MTHTLSSGHRPEIDGLRAVAVLGVLLNHFGFNHFDGGFTGVDIFFVISGFLITRTIRAQASNETFSLGDFYYRRVKRILPALFAVLALSAAAAFALLSPPYLAAFGSSLVHTVFCISNVKFWTESGYFATDASFKPLLHTWSLSVEEQFYIVWPPFVCFLSRPNRRAAAPYVMAAVGALSFAACWLMQRTDASAAFFFTPFRAFELILGGLLTWIDPARIGRRAGNVAVGLGLVAIYASFRWLSKDSAMPGLPTLLPCGGAALIIIGGANAKASRLLCTRLFTHVGRISYSLYLVHWPLFVFYKYLAFRPLQKPDRYWLMIGALILAQMIYQVVEEPLRSGSVPARLSKAGYGLACAMAALLLILPAAHMWASRGLPWRLGADGAIFNEFPYDESEFQLRFYGGRDCAEQIRCVHAGTDGQPPIYVLGDSHARAYVDGLHERFPTKTFIHIAANGCPLYTLRYRNRRADAEHHVPCDKARAVAFAELKDSGATVILAQGWTFNRFESIDKREILELNDADKYAAFIDREVTHLQKELGLGKITLVGPVPTFGRAGSPLDCWGRRFTSRAFCRESSGGAVAERDGINKSLAATLHVAFVNPYDALCSGGTCLNFVDGRPVYSDDNHLSIWGSRHVVNRLAAGFEAATRRH